MIKNMFLLAIINMSLRSHASECPKEAILIAGHCGVNLVAVLSNSSNYFGRKIETQGYLAKSAHGYYLALTKDDLDYSISYDALLVGNRHNLSFKNVVGMRVKIRGTLVEKEDMVAPAAYYLDASSVRLVIPAAVMSKPPL
jgi:hypothetical protein